MSEVDLTALAKKMRANSERWFPSWHSDQLPVPLDVAYALGLVGEAGEVANVVKKRIRDGATDANLIDLAAELADVFTYLMLLADECGIDMMYAYEMKLDELEYRHGDKS